MYVLFALAGAAAAGIGAALMKFGISSRFPRLGLKSFLGHWRSILGAVLTNRVWLLGLLLGISSGFLMAQAMSGGDLSVVQIIANTASLWSVAIGVLFFSERLAGAEWFALGLVLTGALLVSLSRERTGGGDPMIPALAGIAALSALIMFASYLYSRGSRFGLGAEFLLAVDAGLGFGLINVLMKLSTWHAVADLGSFNAVGAASWAHLVTHLPFWLMVASALPALFFLQAAFAHGRVAVVMPLHIVFINVVAILSAMLVFGESLDSLRGTGILAALIGAGVMAQHSRRRAEERAAVNQREGNPG